MSFPPLNTWEARELCSLSLLDSTSHLKVRHRLDAFSGSACVAYEFKRHGYQVHSNDFFARVPRGARHNENTVPGSMKTI